MRMISWLFLTAFTLLTAACATGPYMNPVSEGVVKTEGVTIRSEDGSFSLQSGERFTPPFQFPKYHTGANPPTSENFNECTCRKVRVKVPGRDQELYGLLRLSMMFANAHGPGSRSYLIEIPQSYINEARNGNISVVYEKVPLKGSEWRWQTGWTLWLSDLPMNYRERG